MHLLWEEVADNRQILEIPKLTRPTICLCAYFDTISLKKEVFGKNCYPETKHTITVYKEHFKMLISEHAWWEEDYTMDTTRHFVQFIKHVSPAHQLFNSPKFCVAQGFYVVAFIKIIFFST